MLTLFHDYTSPASAIAVVRVQRLADEGLPVEFVGFDALGVDVALPPSLDVLAAVGDLATVAAAEGVVLRRPRMLPPTALAHLAGELAERRGLGASWRQTCYRAVWTDGADIADRDVLAALGTAAGLDPGELASVLADRRLLAEARRRTGAHRREGVGGVPTILASRTLVPGLLDDADLRALAAY